MVDGKLTRNFIAYFGASCFAWGVSCWGVPHDRDGSDESHSGRGAVGGPHCFITAEKIVLKFIRVSI